MKKLSLAIQLYSLRSLLEDRFKETLRELAVHDALPLDGDCMTASTELGTGCMDLKAVYETAVETGVRWIVLEQHKLRDDPLESARRNFKYCMNLL